jgi:hypothetical protein
MTQHQAANHTHAPNARNAQELFLVSDSILLTPCPPVCCTALSLVERLALSDMLNNAF